MKLVSKACLVFMVGLLSFAIPYYSLFAAISYDSTSQYSTNSVGTATWSHTVSGTDTILFVYGFARPFQTPPTSVEYNGVALTLLESVDKAYFNDTSYLYYLVNPDTGTHDIEVNLSSSNYQGWVAVSYNGADQSAPTSSGIDPGANPYNPFSIAGTSDEANQFLVAGFASDDGDCTPGTGVNERQSNNPFTIADMQVSGSYSMYFSICGNRNSAIAWALFSEASGGSGPGPETGTTTEPMQAETFASILYVISTATFVYFVVFLVRRLTR